MMRPFEQAQAELARRQSAAARARAEIARRHIAPLSGPAGGQITGQQRQSTVQPLADRPQNNDALQSFARTMQGYGQNTGEMLRNDGSALAAPRPAPVLAPTVGQNTGQMLRNDGAPLAAPRSMQQRLTRDLPTSVIDLEAPPVQINGAWHPAGTTAEMVANMPEGFVYDPRTRQYRDVNLEAQMRDRGAMQAAIGGGMQGVSLGAGDEILGGIAGLVQGPAGGALMRETTRAQLANDRQDNPWAAIGGEIAGAVALPAAAIRGAGWLRDIGRAAGLGALYGGVYAFNSGEGSLRERAENVPFGMGLGAVGGAISVPLAQAASGIAQRFGRWAGGIVGQRQFFRNGELTERGRRVLMDAGINPDDFRNEFQRQFARQAAQAANPQDAAAISSMAEFGIPPVRANVTGSPEDFATIAAAQRGAMGEPARQRVGAVMDAQTQAMRNAGERIATDLSGGQVFGAADAAAGVMEGLRGAQAAARQAASQAYEALEAAGGGLRGTQIVNFGTRIGERLRMLNIRIPQDATNSRGALQLLDDVFAGAERGVVPFMQIERARQDLVRLNAAAQRGSNGIDARAMTEIIGQFDEQLDDLMTTAMTEGNEAVLNLARQARGLWSQYRQTFAGRDAGSRFIQRMIDEDASPDQAVRWLFSAGRLGSGQFNSTIARQVKEVLGEASDQWSALRQAAFRHLIQRADGTPQPGPQQMRTNINEFLNGAATQRLSAELFTSQERAMMRRFAGALNRMIPPPGAINYSGTAYENARMAQRAFQAIAGMVGMANAGPGGAMMGLGAANVAQNMMTSGAIRNALSPMPFRPAGAALAAPLAVTTGQTQNLLGSNRPQ